jgi:ParB family chromosome partitioning protein
MSEKPMQRRGLGRGLGSLIPTGPRPQQSSPTGDGPDGERHGSGHGDGRDGGGSGVAVLAAPAVPGSADWIGVSLPGEPDASEPVRTGFEEPAPAPSPADVQPADGHPADVHPADVRVESAADAAGSGDRTAAEAGGGAWFAELPVGSIQPNPRQPREVFDEEAMAELVHSIREVGLLQPVVVRPLDGDRYELVMGERRWRATQEAGLSTIPAIVRETRDEALLRDALLENLHRAQLNALEEAAAYSQLLEDFGCTHDELAARIGRSRPQISNTLRLLKLSPAVQRRVAAGVVSAGHARALLAVESPEAQDRLAARVVAEGISVRSLEEIVAVGDLGGAATSPRRSRPTAPGVDDLAARLSDRLDTRVRVDLGRRKGRITVEFASLPDLERIVALIDPGHPTRTRRADTDDESTG